MHQLPATTTTTSKLTVYKLLALAIGVAALVLGTLLSGFAGAVQAQQASVEPTDIEFQDTDNQITLTAIPPRLGEEGDLRLDPGEKTQITIRVRNTSSETIQVRTTARDFIVDDDGETPIPLNLTDDASNRWSLASWLTMTPSLHTLGPNQTAGISVLIEVPEDALPGGHYAMITHEPDTGQIELGENGEPLSASGISQRVGTLVYLVVNGPINEQAFVRNLTFPKFTEFGPVPYNFTVENDSDIHIRPRISVEIYNLFGQRVEVLQPEIKNVFPLSSRDYAAEWERVWGFGRYTAKLTMSYGTQGQVTIAKTAFWLFPLRLVLAVIIVLLALIATGITIRRHLHHRADNSKQVIEELEQKISELERQNKN